MKITRFKIVLSGAWVVLFMTLLFDASAQVIPLQHVTIFQEKSLLGNGEVAAAEMLSEEVGKRTGTKWPVSATWPVSGDVVVLKKASAKTKVPFSIPTAPELDKKGESFRI